MSKIIKDVFPEEYVAVVKGGREENKQLLSYKYDYIFFTGSQSVGKEVLRSASEHLTPVALELGGKSPCIIDKTANIDLSAKRIVFGKFLNCGQTCVAPDYILCEESIKQELIKAIKKEIIKQFGENPIENSNYGKIINEKHFNRVRNLIDFDKTIIGGKTNPETLKIEPTVLDNITWADNVMKEEIFGPVLPILTFKTINEVVETVENHSHPLALYVFSTNKKNINFITHRF